ncbi:penicillin amidase [Agromyces terreus]|uniref:Penicillin amidase n=1 Tax=Agromyces terreus TaxID=424795 RepID=A0A9X2GZF2_9MICO|nr:penicillin acylase family protein [Agromyces terreus]MCP2370296.1 penicillin amidase [Agromyces terreus]
MIARDERGIPYVRGADVFELAAAQGEAAAHDRGWQIEVDRRRAEGTLSALIGPAGLEWDVFARRARLDDTARRGFASLGDEDRAFVRSYVDGMRRGMREVGVSAPEFADLDALFGERAPLDEWPEHAPLGILHVAHALFSSFPSLLFAEHVARTLGDEWVDALAGGDDVEPASGSNAWAVHGSLTASGFPMLAGDPHRLFELPGVYQQVGLACDEFDVIGLAFPGVPGIAHFGHTGHAAWGITNALAHGVDVFRERLRPVTAAPAPAGRGGAPAPAGRGGAPAPSRDQGGHHAYEALGPDGWHAASVVRSTIGVRGGGPVAVEAIETERGTVITDLTPLPDGEFEAWSVRMPARSDRDLGFAALLPLLRARSAADVVAAFDRWVDPVNRLLAADRAGAVLSATVGRAPDRARAERRLPLDGRVARPVADRRMPRAVVVDTVAVDANERPTNPDVDLGRAYAPPHRAHRIRDLLDERRPGGVDELAPIWGDVRLGGLDDWLALLPGEGDAGPGAGPSADADADVPAVRRALDELRAWNGEMQADSPGAARFAAFREALVAGIAALPELERLHDPHPFGAIFDPWMGARGRIAAALPGLLHSPLLAGCRDGLVRDALAAAAARPPEAWGDEHRLLPLHVFADVPGADDPGRNLDAPLAGDGETVRSTGSTPGVTRRSWRGSVARWAWDLGERDRSRWGVPFGASGDPASPHFADQLAEWVAADPPCVGPAPGVPSAGSRDGAGAPPRPARTPADGADAPPRPAPTPPVE